MKISAQNGETGATKKKQPMNLSTKQTQQATDQRNKKLNVNGNLNTEIQKDGDAA